MGKDGTRASMMTVSDHPTGVRRRLTRGALKVTIALTAVLALAAGSAQAASFGIESLVTTRSTTVAGAHPDFTTEFTVPTVADPVAGIINVGDPRTIITKLPAGMTGDPRAVPTCKQSEFAAFACPAESQIGTAEVNIPAFGGLSPEYPVFNMERRNDTETARLAFNALGNIVVNIQVSVDAPDNRLTATVDKVARVPIGISGTRLTVWGVPGDPIHDSKRFDMFGGPAGPVSIPAKPFLTNPTRCGVPVTTDMWVAPWEDPDHYQHATSTLATQTTDCDRLDFRPRFSMQPHSTVAGSPSGYDVTIDLPQHDELGEATTAQLRDAVVTLPEGVTISPASADGLASCDDAHLKPDAPDPAACPDASKIGTTEVEVPMLPGTLRGGVYLREPQPGHLFRLVLTATGFGVNIKIPGEAVPDPLTGRLTVTFRDAPQQPFSKLRLHLKGGPRAALSTPNACGTYATHAELSPWAWSTPTVSDDPMTIDQGCSVRFAPAFAAGVVNPVAGSSSSFVMRLTRSGGQNLTGVEVTLPPGLVGLVKSVPLCPEPQAAAGTCGAASRIGDTRIAVGPGSSPLSIPQAGKAPTAVYLAGPYKGAPFSLAIVVPAQAGPFDLGTVVVRAALFVDPDDAHVTVKSDPLPQILQGVPLEYRDVEVTIDRPGFMLAPTSCDPMQLGGVAVGREGARVALSSQFQVSGCRALPFTPRVSLALSGRGQTRDGDHPLLSARVDPKAGEANIRKVRVTLPRSLALDPGNAQALCTVEQDAAGTCPAASIVGSATAESILHEPLVGPVYFVEGLRTDPKTGRKIKTLPTLTVVLRGEGVELRLHANSEVDDFTQQLVTTFDDVPDVPISSFDLKISGGEHGILVVSGADICKSNQIAEQQIDGHNGKVSDGRVHVATTACPMRVRSRRLTARGVVLRVSGLGAGTVRVSGKGLRTTRRTLHGSTVATVRAKLTRYGKRMRRSNRRFRVRVSFDPAGPRKAARIQATVRG